MISQNSTLLSYLDSITKNLRHRKPVIRAQYHILSIFENRFRQMFEPPTSCGHSFVGRSLSDATFPISLLLQGFFENSEQLIWQSSFKGVFKINLSLAEILNFGRLEHRAKIVLPTSYSIVICPQQLLTFHLFLISNNPRILPFRRNPPYANFNDTLGPLRIQV